MSRPTAFKLTARMRRALVFLAAHGELHRWPGGWWTYAGCRFTNAGPLTASKQNIAFRRPVEHALDRDMQVLVDNGLAENVRGQGVGATVRRITEKGRAALEECGDGR